LVLGGVGIYDFRYLRVFLNGHAIGTRRVGDRWHEPGQFDLTLSGARHVQADAQGKFSFPPTSGAKAILAFARESFALVTPKELAASPTVKLQPWGRVVGQLKIGSQPGINQTIDLSYMSGSKPNGHSVFLETKTDSEGRFVFEGVPPWFLQVAHRLNFREGQPGPIPQTQQTPVEVRAGETSFVALGGTGFKVVGKIVFNGSAGQIDWQSDVQTLATKFPGIPKPPGGHVSQTAFMKWLDDQQTFLDSEAGHKALLRRRAYVLVFNQDGSFKIDDVAPGTYELKIQISDTSKPTPGPVGFHQKMASLTREVNVPELGPSEEHGSIDLGVIELK